MMRLAPAVLLGTVLLLGGGSAAFCQGNSDDLRYWYLDIYEPFFRVETSSGPAAHAPDAHPEAAQDRGAPAPAALVPARPGARESRVPLVKPDGAYRVFLVGGSVAHRFENPPPARGADALARLLERAMPGKQVSVINCGMGGYDSYRDSLVFDQVLDHGPDLIVLMSGNNDFSGSAGPPPLKVRASLRIRELLGWRTHLERGPAPDGPPRTMEEYRGQFAGNLRAMARAAKAAGVPLVLCTLPRRLGQPPSGPLLLWKRSFFDAWVSWEKRDWDAAQAGFEAHLKTAPDDYMARYYAGRCREARGDRDGALEAYRDALMPDVNQVIRQVAREEGTLLADLEASFLEAAGGPRLERQFSDMVHWRRALDPLVSDTIVRAVRQGGAAGKPPATPLKAEDAFESRVLSAFWEASAGALGQAGNRLRPSEAAVWMLESLWHEEPSRMERLLGEKGSLRARYLRNPSHIGGKEDFERLWRAGLAPLGEAAARTGRVERAVGIFKEALAADPASADARLRLSVWLARSGRTAEARESFGKLASWKESLPEAGWYRETLSIPEETGR